MKAIFNPLSKKVIFFDLHDTLVDKQRSFKSALAYALEEFTARWDGPVLDAGASAERYMKEWTQRSKAKTIPSSRKMPSASRQQLRIRSLDIALQDAPFGATPDLLRSILLRSNQLRSNIPVLFPDVRETLEQLSGQYKLAIISNGRRERLLDILVQSGLHPLFPLERVFTPASPDQRKPHPDLFRHALHTLGISASEAVMVGNSWKHDIFGATRAGIDAIWFKPDHKKTTIRRIGNTKVISIKGYKPLIQLFGT